MGCERSRAPTRSRSIQNFPLLAIAQIGCASIVSGQNQKISIESIPSGAQVAIDGTPAGKTPLVTKVSRKRSHEIRVRMEGYEEESRVTYKGNNYWVLGSILIGSFVGAAIDLSTGAAYTVEPDRFAVTLTERSEKHRPKDSVPE